VGHSAGEAKDGAKEGAKWRWRGSRERIFLIANVRIFAGFFMTQNRAHLQRDSRNLDAPQLPQRATVNVPLSTGVHSFILRS
jgi:hypothetical protein